MLLILTINRSRLSSFIMNLLHLMPLLIWSRGHQFYPVKGQDLETKTIKICPLCPKGYQRKNVEKNVLCDPSSPATDHSHIDMSKCTRCPPNHYQHLISSGVCSPCPPNTFTDNTIITQNCTATTEQLTECPPGNFKRDSDGRCVSCCPSKCTNFNWFKQCYKSYQQCPCSKEDDVKKFSKELGLNFAAVKEKGDTDEGSGKSVSFDSNTTLDPEAVAGDNNETKVNATRLSEGYKKNTGEHHQDNIIWIVAVIAVIGLVVGLVYSERRFRWSTKIWNHSRTATMEMQSSSSNGNGDVSIEITNESDPLLHREYTQKDDDENTVTTVAITDEKSVTDCATSTTATEESSSSQESVHPVTTVAIADEKSVTDCAATTTTTTEESSNSQESAHPVTTVAIADEKSVTDCAATTTTTTEESSNSQESAHPVTTVAIADEKSVTDCAATTTTTTEESSNSQESAHPVTTVAIADEKSVTDCAATTTTTTEESSNSQESAHPAITVAIADDKSDYAVAPKVTVARDADFATTKTTTEDGSVQHLDPSDEIVHIFGDPRNNCRYDSMDVKRAAASIPYLDVHARNDTPDGLSESQVSGISLDTPSSAFSKPIPFSDPLKTPSRGTDTSNTPTPDNLSHMYRRGSTPGNSSDMSYSSSSCNSSRVSTPDGQVYNIGGRFVIDKSNTIIKNSIITIHNYGDEIIQRGSDHRDR